MNTNIHANGRNDHRKILNKEFKKKIKNTLTKFFSKTDIKKEQGNVNTSSNAYSEYKEQIRQSDYNLY